VVYTSIKRVLLVKKHVTCEHGRDVMTAIDS